MDAVQHTVVSSTTRAMDAQLSQLGGSDLARVGTGSVWVRVAPAAPEAPGAPAGLQSPEETYMICG